MTQCDTCISSKGRGDDLPCDSHFVNAANSGNCIYYMSSEPWLEKWILQPSCYIVGLSKKELTYIGVASDKPAVWNVRDGKCFNNIGGRLTKYDLIPREPSIEDTPEFKAFDKIWECSYNKKKSLEDFKKLKEVFNFDLKKKK